MDLEALRAAHTAAAHAYALNGSFLNGQRLSAAYRAWLEADAAADPLYADAVEAERQRQEAAYDYDNAAQL